MAEIAELTAQNMLKLPEEIAGYFRTTDRFLVWREGDTLYLKRITPPAVLDRVAEAPEEEPLSLDDINVLVHDARRHKIE
jgi:hypothetical protein